MYRFAFVAALLLSAITPAAAATVDPTLIPDGTYTAKVERVQDDKHVLLKMNNGMDVLIGTTRPNVSFAALSPGSDIRLSIIKGGVAVYAKA